MSILTVSNINHVFGGRVIFEDVSFRLLKGEHVGLIGANGEGKSSFMNIITSKLVPDQGSVVWAKNVRIGYMDQQSELERGLTIREELRKAFSYLFEIEETLTKKYEQMAEADEELLNTLMEETAELQSILDISDFYTIDVKIDEIAAGMGLSDIGLDRRTDELSGGQRNKVLMAKLLLKKPDILLLDEPTNYLDEEHIAWLKTFLLNYENAFILISHDMEFLNDVVNLIYHMEEAKLTRYVGNYEDFLRLYEQHKRHQDAAYERQQQEIAGLQDFIARNKARVATAGMARARQKKLDKMDIIEKTREKPKPEFNFRNGRTSDKLIFEAKDLVIGYDEPLTKPLNLLLERKQKVCIIGANGLGKTTLLRSLLGEIPSISGTIEKGQNQLIGYFEQELNSDNTNTCIEDVWEVFPSYTQYEIRSALAKCGLTTAQLESKIYVLSGGEQAKVRLCKLINRETNILILDEPTNHLDVDAKNELKRALKEYSGTILMVCHEPEFYNDIVSSVWDLADSTLKIV